MKKPKSDFFAYGVSALVGLLVCLCITMVTGDDKGWDSDSYYYVGIPVMCVFAYLLGYSFPVAPWRWVMGMSAGQFSSIIFSQDDMIFWWLTFGFIMAASIPQLIAANIGASVGWSRSRADKNRGNRTRYRW